MNSICKVFFIAILIFLKTNAFSTVSGPIIIDIIGYDSVTNTVYFAQTSWAECDCETDLYQYNISNDSLEIIPKWAERHRFSKDKGKVIREKGLDYLSPKALLTPKELTFKFAWLPKITYYSQVMMKDTVNCPFQVLIGNKVFKYTQCYNQSFMPIITEFRIKNYSGIILIRYNGDCFEGNTLDKIIFYQQNKNLVTSRELNVQDKLSKD